MCHADVDCIATECELYNCVCHADVDCIATECELYNCVRPADIYRLYIALCNYDDLQYGNVTNQILRWMIVKLL